MKAVIVYESMYGNTHAIADAIAEGFDIPDVSVVGVKDASQALIDQAELLVVGGPTQVHGMSRPSTRKGAIDEARKPGSRLTIDPGADGPGVRDWLAGLGGRGKPAAAFDTRLNGPATLTGRASKSIAKLLRKTGFTVVAEPESFLVSQGNELLPDQLDRAKAWGAALASRVGAASG